MLERVYDSLNGAGVPDVVCKAVCFLVLLVPILGLMYFGLPMLPKSTYRSVQIQSQEHSPVALPNHEIHTNIITLAHFHAIKDGMRESEVDEILPRPGIEESRTNIAGNLVVQYRWTNADGSNMSVMYQDYKLVNKAQFGLK